MTPQGNPRPQDPDLVLAGISVFQRFGWINSVDKLANGDATQWRQALNLSFEYGVTKLELEADRTDFNKRYNEIMKAKFERENPKK